MNACVANYFSYFWCSGSEKKQNQIILKCSDLNKHILFIKLAWENQGLSSGPRLHVGVSSGSQFHISLQRSQTPGCFQMLAEKAVGLSASLRILYAISVHIWQNLMTLEPLSSLKFHIGRDPCMCSSFRDNTIVPDTDSRWDLTNKKKQNRNKHPPKKTTPNPEQTPPPCKISFLNKIKHTRASIGF